MKITNKHIGYLMYLILVLLLQYKSQFATWDELDILAEISFVIVWLHHIAFIIITLIRLLDNDIKFEFTIPNPFKSIKESYQEKRRYTAELKEIYHIMAKAQDDKTLDLLIRKKELLEQKLKIKL